MATERVKLIIEHKTIIECPVSANRAESLTFAENVMLAVRSGQRLTSASVVTSGHQRDPYVTGIRLMFTA